MLLRLIYSRVVREQAWTRAQHRSRNINGSVRIYSMELRYSCLIISFPLGLKQGEDGAVVSDTNVKTEAQNIESHALQSLHGNKQSSSWMENEVKQIYSMNNDAFRRELQQQLVDDRNANRDLPFVSFSVPDVPLAQSNSGKRIEANVNDAKKGITWKVADHGSVTMLPMGIDAKPLELKLNSDGTESFRIGDTTLTRTNCGDTLSVSANGFTLSKHDSDGKWYLHEDNSNGKFVEVDANSISLEENGMVKYRNKHMSFGTRILGSTDKSIFVDSPTSDPASVLVDSPDAKKHIRISENGSLKLF